MKTISPKSFYANYMVVSETLTSSELRMLYLLIEKPETIELTQDEFAKKIKTNRRTINIGLSKLSQLGYISGLDKKDKKRLKEERKLISPEELAHVKKGITNIFQTYHVKNKGIPIINEDLIGIIIGSHLIHEHYREDERFIVDTIKKQYPNCKFYQDKTAFISEVELGINHFLNDEINSARKRSRYSLNKTEVFETLCNQYNLDEDEILKIIKSQFPKLTLKNDQIKIPRPWKTSKTCYNSYLSFPNL